MCWKWHKSTIWQIRELFKMMLHHLFCMVYAWMSYWFPPISTLNSLIFFALSVVPSDWFIHLHPKQNLSRSFFVFFLPDFALLGFVLFHQLLEAAIEIDNPFTVFKMVYNIFHLSISFIWEFAYFQVFLYSPQEIKALHPLCITSYSLGKKFDLHEDVYVL